MHYLIEARRNEYIRQGALTKPEWVVEQSTHIAYLREGFMLFDKVLTASDMSDILFRSPRPEASFINRSFDKVCAYLLATATAKSTDSWRKSRSAIAYCFAYMGCFDLARKVKALKNPVSPADRPGKTGRAKRRKEVSEEEMQLVFDERMQCDDPESAYLLYLCWGLGIRPGDAPKITFSLTEDKTDLIVTLPPGKPTAKGKLNATLQRGQSRDFAVEANPVLKEALLHWGSCSEASTKTKKDVIRATARIMTSAKKLIKSKGGQHFVLYTCRYEMGAQLKLKHAQDVNGVKITGAVLGHASATSQALYGNIRSARGGRSLALPRPSAESVANVRDNRQLPPVSATKGLLGQNNPRRKLSSAATQKRDAARKPSERDKKISAAVAAKKSTPDMGPK